MGKPTGFIEIQRKKQPTRPVEERVQDWQEIYLPYPTGELEMQGARCMDCGIPFCHQGCPLGGGTLLAVRKEKCDSYGPSCSPAARSRCSS